MKVYINGIGAVGRFGCGIQSLLQAVEKPNPCDHQTGVSVQNEMAITGSPLNDEMALLAHLVSQKALRRVDRYSRMAVLAGWMALTDGENEEKKTGNPFEPMGIIVATGLGPTAVADDSRSDSTGMQLSPIQFSNSVHNAAAAYISMLLKIRGPNLSINHYDLSVPLAFQTAVDWLEEGRVRSVLVGGIDCCQTISAGIIGNPDLRQRQHTDNRQPSVCGGSAFFVLSLSPKSKFRYPCIQDVQIGKIPDGFLPSFEALVLHNESQQESGYAGPEFRQISFSNIYGVFPSSMALDIAVAALLLEKDRLPTGSPAQVSSCSGFLKSSRIRCLKKGITGHWGLVDLERIPPLAYPSTVSPANP